MPEKTWKKGDVIRPSNLNRLEAARDKVERTSATGAAVSKQSALVIAVNQDKNLSYNRDCVRSCFTLNATPIWAGSVVSVVGGYEDTLEVGLPEDGSPHYGIVVTAVEPNGFGYVALSGGPYPLLTDGTAAAGDILAPVEDSWAATVTTEDTIEDGMWKALSGPNSSNLVWAIFCAAYPPAPSVSTLPVMVKCHVSMTADDTYYLCYILGADGTEGASYSCKRPPGLAIFVNDIGFVGQDRFGAAMFIPCHLRKDAGQPLVVERRDDDLGFKEVGSIWIREDLMI